MVKVLLSSITTIIPTEMTLDCLVWLHGRFAALQKIFGPHSCRLSLHGFTLGVSVSPHNIDQDNKVDELWVCWHRSFLHWSSNQLVITVRNISRSSNFLTLAEIYKTILFSKHASKIPWCKFAKSLTLRIQHRYRHKKSAIRVLQ